MRIPFMSKASGARLILDTNLQRQASQVGQWTVKTCPVCGARCTVKRGQEIGPHFKPGRKPGQPSETCVGKAAE